MVEKENHIMKIQQLSNLVKKNKLSYLFIIAIIYYLLDNMCTGLFV